MNAQEPRTEAGRTALIYYPDDLDLILAIEAEAGRLDKERLARVLHDIGGEFDDPFTPDHPQAMHNSQAAAIAVGYETELA